MKATKLKIYTKTNRFKIKQQLATMEFIIELNEIMKHNYITTLVYKLTNKIQLQMKKKQKMQFSLMRDTRKSWTGQEFSLLIFQQMPTTILPKKLEMQRGHKL